MQTYLDGQALVLAIPLADEAGACYEVSAVTYRIIDQSGVELVASVSLSGFASGDAQAIVSVSGLVNALEVDGPRRAMRIVQLNLTTAGGIHHLFHEYLIDAAEVLELGFNSFQSYYESVLLGMDIPGLERYNSATRSDRISGMIGAWRNISHVYLDYSYDLDILGDQSRLIMPEAQSGNLTLLSAADFRTLPNDMQKAVCRAQVIEADFLLGGDFLGDLRRQGIITTITGESATYFSDKKPYEGPLCKKAMKEVGKYLVHSFRLGRT